MLLGGATTDIVLQLCKFASSGYKIFTVPTVYRFLDYYDQSAGGHEEPWPCLRSAVLACVAMQWGSVSDLVRYLASVDEMDACFAAGGGVRDGTAARLHGGRRLRRWR